MLIIKKFRVIRFERLIFLNKLENQKEIENAEAKVFVDLFHAYDTQKSGRIKAEHLYEIATMIGKESHNGIF